MTCMYILFSAVSIFTITGIALHRDPGMRSSSLNSSGKYIIKPPYHVSNCFL